MRTGIGRTHIGKVRSKNQDTVYVSDGPLGPFQSVFIVADGMGGHLAGEVASAMAARAFRDHLAAFSNNGLTPEKLLEEAIINANVTVFTASIENPDYSGMGTTKTISPA